jgi:YVTN family beta-propeller protein
MMERRNLSWLALPAAITTAATLAVSCEKETLSPVASLGSTSSGSADGGAGGASVAPYGTNVSSTLALSQDDTRLWVVNADSDSVSVIDTQNRTLVSEIPLGTSAPALDPNSLRYDPVFEPRALAMAHGKIYVAAEAKNAVIVIDTQTLSIVGSIDVPAAPVGIAAAPDGHAVYVVSHEAGVVTAIDSTTDRATGSVSVPGHPWGASVSADGSTLFVTHLLLNPGVSVIDTQSLTLNHKVLIADQPAGHDQRIPNGVARGAFTVVPSPTTGELWVPYMLLGIGTPQPALDFESTVFPTISAFDAMGMMETRRLLFQPPGLPEAKGSYADTASGPHAMAFTPNGHLALVAFGQSEDVMVFDATTGFEKSLVRPIPSTMLEGIVIDHTGTRAFVDGRNTHDITVLAIDESKAPDSVFVEGASIERLTGDPMPADLRRGQRLFYSANSAELATTTDFWVACATCHIEGGSDAVTWLFNAGPRDTPSNAGGPSHSGFLMRQALRSEVQQYDATIRIEQGGHYSLLEPTQTGDLDALAAFVNEAIPYPPNPNIAASGLTPLQTNGRALFASHCATCHTGPYLTDSGAGNPGLDFSGPILLHDIGTCATTGSFRDQPSLDVTGVTHTACDFDTPSLRGVFATPPYFHDGSAATLADVVSKLPFSAGLSSEDQANLVEYLETL